MMEYKWNTNDPGQITTVDEDQGLIHGRVAGLVDVITFEGKTFEEFVQAFHDSVDDYLEFCQERQDQPEKPFSRAFHNGRFSHYLALPPLVPNAGLS